MSPSISPSLSSSKECLFTNVSQLVEKCVESDNNYYSFFVYSCYITRQGVLVEGMFRVLLSFSAHTSFWKWPKALPLHHTTRSKQIVASPDASDKALKKRFRSSNDGDAATMKRSALFVSEQQLPPNERVSNTASSSNGGRDSSAGSILYLREELRSQKEELQSTQHQLLQTQIRLAQMEHQPLSRFYTAALDQLSRLDREAHEEATAIRYTAMALQASHDRLEVELRRVLGIGLTAGEIDAAAIEAAARHYIRSNIGFRVEQVSKEPPALTAASKVSESAAETDDFEESSISFPDTSKHNEY
ncbi:unnamed protein product [Phytomonas sp. EM1]|nr:unnamed protein product [Phytomonas sp. EM1]|eukprot:CCW62958.1 unnamed protein product [Phytomonas sp. isolate EM1]